MIEAVQNHPKPLILLVDDDDMVRNLFKATMPHVAFTMPGADGTEASFRAEAAAFESSADMKAALAPGGALHKRIRDGELVLSAVLVDDNMPQEKGLHLAGDIAAGALAQIDPIYKDVRALVVSGHSLEYNKTDLTIGPLSTEGNKLRQFLIDSSVEKLSDLRTRHDEATTPEEVAEAKEVASKSGIAVLDAETQRHLREEYASALAGTDGRGLRTTEDSDAEYISRQQIRSGDIPHVARAERLPLGPDTSYGVPGGTPHYENDAMHVRQLQANDEHRASHPGTSAAATDAPSLSMNDTDPPPNVENAPTRHIRADRNHGIVRAQGARRRKRDLEAHDPLGKQTFTHRYRERYTEDPTRDDNPGPKRDDHGI